VVGWTGEWPRRAGMRRGFISPNEAESDSKHPSRGAAVRAVKDREGAMLDLLERQTRLTVNQWKIISAAILGDMLDFFDFFLIGYVLVFIVTQWKLTFLESGVILLAAGVG
jgi:hypothetical protein